MSRRDRKAVPPTLGDAIFDRVQALTAAKDGQAPTVDELDAIVLAVKGARRSPDEVAADLRGALPGVPTNVIAAFAGTGA